MPNHSSTILLVDDEDSIQTLLTYPLERDGYRVVQARDGEEALRRFGEGPVDLVVLDIMLPRVDGLEVCRRLRAESTVPIIMLTARDDELDKVLGLELGADDYLTKPFKMEELIARLRAILRRTHGHASPTLRAGKLSLDTNQMRVTTEGRTLALTPLEYRLVSYMLHHKGRVVPGTELLEHVYGNEDAREVNAIEALIVRLRRKLGAEAIETRRGQGYLVKDGDA